MSDENQTIENQVKSDTNPLRKRAISDLRSTVLQCHNQISKDLWGKKNANSFVDHLQPSEVEAFALDIGIRVYWELNRVNDEYAQCSLSAQGTSYLRQLILDVLEKNQEQYTKEYSFDIPDPVIVAQRERLKQEQIEEARIQKEKRLEAAKKEREERAKRMALKKKALEERKALEAKKKAEAEMNKNDETNKIQKNTDISNDSEELPVQNKISKPTITDTKKTPIKSGLIQISKPITSGNTNKKTNDSISSFRAANKFSSGNSFKITPPPKKDSPQNSDNPIAKFAATKRNFIIKPPPKKKELSSTITISSPKNSRKTQISESPKLKKQNTLLSFQQQHRKGKKKEKTFTRLPIHKQSSTEEEPIPNITIKQKLVNTGQLVHIIQKIISDNYSSLKKQENEEKYLDFYHCTVKGPRPANEDEYAIVEHLNEYLGIDKEKDRYAFFGAYDGHCGKYTSLFIRSQIHHKVCTHESFPDDMNKAIHDSILQVDRIVNDVQERDEFACGSTVLSCWIKNNEELIVGNVGDCRGFISRSGKPIEIANPHHPTREDEKQRIESLGGAVVKRGAWRVNGILAVSRSVGDNNLKKFVIADPEITRFNILPQDEFIIIASDGLWDVISPEEMIEIVRNTCKNRGRKYVCTTLCDMALEKESKDNVTVIILFFNHKKE